MNVEGLETCPLVFPQCRGIKSRKDNMKEINNIDERDACIEEIVKMTYLMGIPDDPRFKILTLVQMTNHEMGKTRLDCYVEMINHCYKRMGFLASTR